MPASDPLGGVWEKIQSPNRELVGTSHRNLVQEKLESVCAILFSRLGITTMKSYEGGCRKKQPDGQKETALQPQLLSAATNTFMPARGTRTVRPVGHGAAATSTFMRAHGTRPVRQEFVQLARLARGFGAKMSRSDPPQHAPGARMTGVTENSLKSHPFHISSQPIYHSHTLS